MQEKRILQAEVRHRFDERAEPKKNELYCFLLHQAVR